MGGWGGVGGQAHRLRDRPGLWSAQACRATSTNQTLPEIQGSMSLLDVRMHAGEEVAVRSMAIASSPFGLPPLTLSVYNQFNKTSAGAAPEGSVTDQGAAAQLPALSVLLAASKDPSYTSQVSVEPDAHTAGGSGGGGNTDGAAPDALRTAAAGGQPSPQKAHSLQHSAVQGSVTAAPSAVSATVAASSRSAQAHTLPRAPVLPASPRTGSAAMPISGTTAAVASGRMTHARQLLFRGLRLK
jgi:hypothetical protein